MKYMSLLLAVSLMTASISASAAVTQKAESSSRAVFNEPVKWGEDTRYQSYIQNEYFRPIGKEFIFAVHETIGIDAPGDDTGSKTEIDVYHLSDTVPPASKMNRKNRFVLSKKPFLHFRGEEYDFLNNVAGNEPQTISPDSLLHVHDVECCMSATDAYYRLGTGEKLFERSVDIGESPHQDALALQDENAYWLLVTADIAIDKDASTPRYATLTMTAYSAKAKDSKRYRFALPRELYKPCDDANDGCAITLKVTGDEAAQTKPFVYYDPKLGSSIDVSLENNLLLRFQLKDSLSIGNPQTVFTYETLPVTAEPAKP